MEPSEPTLAKTPQHGVLEMSRLVHGSDMLVTQAGGAWLRSRRGVQLLVVALHNACRHNRDVFCDRSHVETIILGQDTAGASELDEACSG